eukprot:gnl/TRDRNA2_/TRDRNA2_91380_c0_seq1.p1 gnl/TRDRNA2_/TRDRNA2_91380_c0~~gnl/TRDRNA2_/TRDRNA2_91380_c0_seq1.p1  ORF type:complete len:276 (+),score=42.18 gnl/TRDRNA2_/TRDRNA2_91380_c0_seq1:1-828(+)
MGAAPGSKLPAKPYLSRSVSSLLGRPRFAAVLRPAAALNPFVSGLRFSAYDGFTSLYTLVRIGPAHIAMAEPAEKEPLTLPRVTELLEPTFVKACMALATGDVTVLKLFIAAAVGGFRLGAELPELFNELSQCDEKTMTANRPLMPEEVELRKLWISLIYLTLELADTPAEGSANPATTVDSTLRNEYAKIVAAIRDQVTAGATLQELSVDSLIGPDPERTPLRKAVLSQSIRVVYLTLQVLDEEATAAGETAARPFIPGTGPRRGDGQPAQLLL